jgi:hypothetical protein
MRISCAGFTFIFAAFGTTEIIVCHWINASDVGLRDRFADIDETSLAFKLANAAFAFFGMRMGGLLFWASVVTIAAVFGIITYINALTFTESFAIGAAGIDAIAIRTRLILRTGPDVTGIGAAVIVVVEGIDTVDCTARAAVADVYKIAGAFILAFAAFAYFGSGVRYGMFTAVIAA